MAMALISGSAHAMRPVKPVKRGTLERPLAFPAPAALGAATTGPAMQEQLLMTAAPAVAGTASTVAVMQGQPLTPTAPASLGAAPPSPIMPMQPLAHPAPAAAVGAATAGPSYGAAASFWCGTRSTSTASAALGGAMSAPVLHRSGAACQPPAHLLVEAGTGGRHTWQGACPSRTAAAPFSAVAVHAGKAAGAMSDDPRATRSALQSALGTRAGRLRPEQYDALIAAQYDTPEALLDASESSLREVLKPAFGAVDAVVAWQRETKQGDDGRLYTGVTLYVLSQGQKGYSTLKKQRTTRKQLQGMWDKYGYDLVTPVDSKPAQLLTIDTCPDCTDMGSVRLEDGIHLAVVMHQPLTFMDLLQDKVTETTDLADELRGFKDNVVAEQENAAASWALEQIKTEPGAQVFCIKEVAKAVELDGAAYSDLSVVIVERKQTFRYSDLEEFVTKLEKLKKLIELGAANTELLQGKELQAYAMAGSWSGSTDEQAAMVRLMNEHHIQSVMPDGSGYQISWGCNPHRPGAASSTTESAARAQRFLDTRARVKSTQPAMLR